MLLLFILGLLGSSLSVPVTKNTEVVPRDDNLSQLYVLPAESFPTFYDVQLFIDPSNIASFNGIASIRIIPYFDTSEIVMHAMELQIQEISITAESSTVNLYDSYTLATDDTHFLRIRTSTPLLALRPYTVTITYSGSYSDNMFGLYVSTYLENGQTVNLVTSQLQPTFARRAFPCYDEPSFKAVFRTTIYAPPVYTTVRSNMPLRNDTLKPDVAGYTKHEFADTLVMSSYLIAYLVSNFEYVDNTQDPLYRVPFRVYSRPGTQNTADFALEFGQKNMVALEEYTEFPFYFPKMDKAAVPDFAAGAMENWGLVIYREVALLVTEGVTTTSTKQNIGRIICHENMHQWFGNEVGPLSWTYTWLNEGFANFFESFATDLVLPEWRMMDQFLLSEQNVFQSDAVLTVNPMTHEVFTPSQILGTFNSVAYQKSGSVIRMMQHFLTPEVFRQGLIIYIRNNSRKAASPSDLYAALQQALTESNHTLPYNINVILDNWVNQGGFPVVNVRRMSPTANSFSISQERFLTDKNLFSNTRWFVPINWVLSTDVDFSDTRPDMWLTTSSVATAYDLPGLSQAEWFIVNKQQTGYYRVNYDVDNWNALVRLLTSSHETIHVLNRAQLVDDSFNLARNGRLDYAIPLEISRYLVQERDYIPWGSANAAFTFLNTVLVGTSIYRHFQNYLLTLTAPLYQELGFTASPTEEWVTPYHRTIITNINCLHGNQDCVNTAEQLLQNFINNPSQTINPDMQTTVFCSGLRGGSEANFNFLWNRYLQTSDATEQSILLNSLGCTTNADSRLFYLNQVIDENSAIRQQDTSSVMTSMINANPENMEVAFDFFIENFIRVQQSVQSLTGTSNILITLANRLTTQEHLNKINDFEARYQTYLTAGEMNAINFIKENIAAAITWNNENLAVVEEWLRENSVGDDDSGATSITANFSVISCICVALYNLL